MKNDIFHTQKTNGYAFPTKFIYLYDFSLIIAKNQVHTEGRKIEYNSVVFIE